MIHALDEAAKSMSAEQPAGRASISRGELVRIALHEWLAAYKARTNKPLQ